MNIALQETNLYLAAVNTTVIKVIKMLNNRVSLLSSHYLFQSIQIIVKLVYINNLQS
jgi:hypothetical protein